MIKAQLMVVIWMGVMSASFHTLASPAAPAAPGRRIEIGVRVGYGLPLGHVGDTSSPTGESKISKFIARQIPIGLDAGYQLVPRIFVGVSLQYGLGFIDDCVPPIRCSIRDIRLGGDIHYHLAPGRTFDPWLGFGAGYEWLHQSLTVPGTLVFPSIRALHGFEFANLQLGGDLTIASHVAIGPFVSFSFGQYRSLTYNGSAQPVGSRSFHEWFLMGVRCTYNIHR